MKTNIEQFRQTIEEIIFKYDGEEMKSKLFEVYKDLQDTIYNINDSYHKMMEKVNARNIILHIQEQDPSEIKQLRSDLIKLEGLKEDIQKFLGEEYITKSLNLPQ